MLPISRLLCTRILAKGCAYSTDAKKLGLETKAGKMSFSLPFKYISAEVGHCCLKGGVNKYLLTQNMTKACVIDNLNESATSRNHKS